MPKFSNIWSKVFNNSSLQKEDWLAPSPQVFENVKAEIYGKKKKRRFFWILPFLLGLGGISAFAYFFNGQFVNEPEKISQGIEKKTQVPQFELEVPRKSEMVSDARTSEITLPVLTAEAEPQQEAQLQAPASTRQPRPKVSGLPATAEKITESGVPVVALKQVVPAAPSKQEAISPVNITTLNSVDEIAKAAELRFLIPDTDTDTDTNTDTDTDTNTDTDTDTDTDDVSKNSESAAPDANLSYFGTAKNSNRMKLFSRLERFYPELEFERNIALKEKIVPPKEEKRVLRNELKLAVGYTNWKFRLNSNYATALDPADFNHQSGHGIVGLVSYARILNDKLAVGVDFSAEQVTAESGHNSSIQYSLENEHGGQVNELMITMASPLGFIESEVVLERTAAAGGAPTQDMILDLHNTHKISNLSLAPVVSYELIGGKRISLIASAGLGVNYLTAIRNNLASFGVDNENFRSVSSQIIAEQTSFRKITAFSSVGLLVKRRFVNQNFIGVSAKWNNNLSPVYKQGDFSSTIIRTQLLIFCGKEF